MRKIALLLVWVTFHLPDTNSFAVYQYVMY